MRMSEFAKVARASMLPTIHLAGVRFGMELGENEVALVHNLHWYWYGTAAAGSNSVSFGLFRKTDSLPPNVWSDHTDTIWLIRDSKKFVTESVSIGGNGNVVFPAPIPLIRPPQLITQIAVILTSCIGMRLYYTVQKLTTADMAKLMAKDHA